MTTRSIPPRAPARSVVVLASGGLDSAALLVWALERYRVVRPVFVRMGLRWETAERRALSRVLRRLRRPGLRPLVELRASAADLYGRHWSLRGLVPGYRSPDAAVYLPGRNLILLTLAGVYAARVGAADLALGVLAGNPFADSRPLFLRSVARSLARALGRRVSVRTPFRRWKKSEVLRRYPDAPFDLAFSCLRPRGPRPCGACNKCAERDLVRRGPFRGKTII